MAEGWFTDLAEANALISAQRLVTTHWNALTDPQKTASLNQAYNRLYYSKHFILPTLAEASSDDLVKLKLAQSEMAYYLSLHLPDEDRRKGIQAQGTIEAGVVEEKYSEDMLTETPIPQFIFDILCEYLAGPTQAVKAIDLARDEEESVDTKVHDF